MAIRTKAEIAAKINEIFRDEGTPAHQLKGETRAAEVRALLTDLNDTYHATAQEQAAPIYSDVYVLEQRVETVEGSASPPPTFSNEGFAI